MNFSEALQHLKDGKKVKRKHWKGGYIYVSKILGSLPYDFILALTDREDESIYNLHNVDIFAEDWEIVE